MATYDQRESGWWQAKIRLKGFPHRSATFKTKKESETWAKITESEMVRGVYVSSNEADKTTLGDVIDRYRREILPKKRGADRDEYRLRQIDTEFGRYALASITPSMLAMYRDERLEYLSPQSVVHELNIINRLLKAATEEWGIPLPGGIPKAKKPTVANGRDRRFLDGEEKLLREAIDKGRVTYLQPLVTLALETAGRQSELLSLDWRDINLQSQSARLRGGGGAVTKTGETYREIPLSKAAVATLEALKPKPKNDLKALINLFGPVFTATSSSAKQAWEHAVKRGRRMYEKSRTTELKNAGYKATAVTDALKNDPILTDLHFHDLRHEATSRLAMKFQIHELMKITGHKSTTMLAQYYHPKVEELARKID